MRSTGGTSLAPADTTTEKGHVSTGHTSVSGDTRAQDRAPFLFRPGVRWSGANDFGPVGPPGVTPSQGRGVHFHQSPSDRPLRFIPGKPGPLHRLVSSSPQHRMTLSPCHGHFLSVNSVRSSGLLKSVCLSSSSSGSGEAPVRHVGGSFLSSRFVTGRCCWCPCCPCHLLPISNYGLRVLNTFVESGLNGVIRASAAEIRSK